METGTNNGDREKHLDLGYVAPGLQGHLEVPCREGQKHCDTKPGVRKQPGLLQG